jgi:ribosomal protein S10
MLLYKSENHQKKQKKETVEMNVFRRMVRISRRYRIKNEEIRI